MFMHVSAGPELYTLPGAGARPAPASETESMAAIAAFFDAYGERLPREWLWELLKAALSSEQSTPWSAAQRADYIQFCERLAGLVEACRCGLRTEQPAHRAKSL